jgi:hypothetical protein
MMLKQWELGAGVFRVSPLPPIATILRNHFKVAFHMAGAAGGYKKFLGQCDLGISKEFAMKLRKWRRLVAPHQIS